MENHPSQNQKRNSNNICFETAFQSENVIKLLKPKAAQNVAIFLGDLFLKKSY